MIYPQPQLAALGFAGTNGFQFRLDSETGGQYLIQKSTNLTSWTPFVTLTNLTGSVVLSDPAGGTNGRGFFNAVKVIGP